MALNRKSGVKEEKGFGRNLGKIFSKGYISTGMYGVFSATIVTVAPMIIILIAIIIMQRILGFDVFLYATRELFTETVLYHFIFSFLFTSTFNAVLSKYMSDQIYMERYDRIWSCYYVGLLCNFILIAITGIPFVIREYIVGQVSIEICIITYIGYVGLSMVMYNMIYLSIVKDYAKISIFYLIGMTVSVLLGYICIKWWHFEEIFGMLFALAVGYVIISALEFAQIRQYFRTNSRDYADVTRFLGHHLKHVFANALYTIGLYVGNFVFWTTDMRKVVVKSFVSCDPYDMASFLALITNITATVIFIVRAELYFRSRYRDYTEAVIGGRGRDIKKAKSRMFRTLSAELVYLARTQFIVSVVLFLIAMIFLPRFGFSGIIMQIYPCLAVGFYEIFIVYASIVFMYYYDDADGALTTSLILVFFSLVGSIIATKLSVIWYGIGPVIGGFAAWTYAYFRLRYIEKKIDYHTFCNGKILNLIQGRPADNFVYDVKRGGMVVEQENK